jgi:hypothetical protein
MEPGFNFHLIDERTCFLFCFEKPFQVVSQKNKLLNLKTKVFLVLDRHYWSTETQTKVRTYVILRY